MTHERPQNNGEKQNARKPSLFDEVQARYRSEPWSNSGRFDYISQEPPSDLYAARHSAIEDNYDANMDREIRRGMDALASADGLIGPGESLFDPQQNPSSPSQK